MLRIVNSNAFISIGVWSKRTLLVGVGVGELGVIEFHGDSPLIVVYIIPQHSTPYASKGDLNLFFLGSSVQTTNRYTSRVQEPGVLKTLKMSWHRMRKAVGGKPEPEEYQQKKAQLEEFKQLENAGKINLYYLDEVGFSLVPSVPYGWQNIGEYLTIPSRHSRRLNVLGIMNRKNHLET